MRMFGASSHSCIWHCVACVSRRENRRSVGALQQCGDGRQQCIQNMERDLGALMELAAVDEGVRDRMYTSMMESAF